MEKMTKLWIISICIKLVDLDPIMFQAYIEWLSSDFWSHYGEIGDHNIVHI